MESLLEEQRRYHEERERLIDTMTKEVVRKKASVSLELGLLPHSLF
jgi:hypothetical protein